MKKITWTFLLSLGGLLFPSLQAAPLIPSAALRSPENQVFQFMYRGTFSYAADDKVSSTAYLWIPEHCRRLRGLLILGENIPEEGLVEHPAIRQACTVSDLGIVWCTPKFMSYKKVDDGQMVVFLQQLLDGLAQTSGYEEVATVPWLPMGESTHLHMVYQLLNVAPQRCIAGIFIKNPPSPRICTNRETPILIAVGTAQEWNQNKIDIRAKWRDLSFYKGFLRERAKFPNWPASVLVDGGSGHFNCPEAMVNYFAAYIIAAVKARVPEEPNRPLLPAAQADGFVAGLPLPGEDTFEPTAFARATAGRRAMPWFFNAALAREAWQTAAINWQAASQLPAFVDSKGKPVPMTYLGITSPVPVETGADGITFEIKGCLLPAIPQNFVAAGAPLAAAPGTPVVDWICGSIAPLGQGRFRIALDRTWPGGPVAVALRQKGTPDIRDAVQPGYLSLRPNKAGLEQTIAFSAIPDQPAGTAFVPLTATSDSGLPVSFFVVAGPAVVEGNALKLTAIPPRTRLPVKITVTAWQWGRSVEPAVQTAPLVSRSFFVSAMADAR